MIESTDCELGVPFVTYRRIRSCVAMGGKYCYVISRIQKACLQSLQRGLAFPLHKSAGEAPSQSTS
jgi:hypothetical protein